METIQLKKLTRELCHELCLSGTGNGRGKCRYDPKKHQKPACAGMSDGTLW